MLIVVKIPIGTKEIEIPEDGYYSWFINENNKTFSLTKPSNDIKFTTINDLISKGYTYAR